MSKYTTELRNLIESNYPIFDFDYHIHETIGKEKFEKAFNKHFYFREIGFETAGQFKHYLEEQLNLLLPSYNKLFMSQALEQRILDNYDVLEEFTRTTNSKNKNTANSEAIDQSSDTPVRRTNIANNDFISSLSKGTSKGVSDGENTGQEKWTRTMKGNIGVQTDADAVIKYETSIRNILQELFGELDILFMGVF